MPSAAPAAHYHARPHDHSYGSMAPSPCLSYVKMPSVSKLAFYHPACSAAPLNAEVLADLKATFWNIAYTISEGRQVPNGWGVVHLARHWDLLVGRPCAIEALSLKIDHDKARQWGEVAPFRICQFHCRSRNQYADDFLMDPGRPPGQAGVLGVVDPASYQGAGSRSLPPTSQHVEELCRVDATLACYHRGGNAIAELGPLFNASSVTSLPPTTEHGGETQRVNGTLTRCSSTGDNAIPEQVCTGSCLCPGAIPMASSSTTRPLTWVDGTLTCYARGDNTITELGASSVSSLSTHHNGTGSYCGGTPCRHDHLLLGLTHFSPSLVPTTASEASPGIVSRRIGVRRVGLG